MDETFGEGGVGWGEPESHGVGAERAPGGDLGNGVSLRIDSQAWAALLKHPGVAAAVSERAQAVADLANGMVAMDPRAVERLNPDGEDAYVVSLHNDPEASRPRARVMPSTTNSLGWVDDSHNSTLYKALMLGGGGAE